MSRQSKWFRDMVARVTAEAEAERAQKMAPPPKQMRMTTEHAREYQRLNQYPYPPGVLHVYMRRTHTRWDAVQTPRPLVKRPLQVPWRIEYGTEDGAGSPAICQKWS